MKIYVILFCLAALSEAKIFEKIKETFDKVAGQVTGSGGAAAEEEHKKLCWAGFCKTQECDQQVTCGEGETVESYGECLCCKRCKRTLLIGSKCGLGDVCEEGTLCYNGECTCEGEIN